MRGEDEVGKVGGGEEKGMERWQDGRGKGEEMG